MSVLHPFSVYTTIHCGIIKKYSSLTWLRYWCQAYHWVRRGESDLWLQTCRPPPVGISWYHSVSFHRRSVRGSIIKYLPWAWKVLKRQHRRNNHTFWFSIMTLFTKLWNHHEISKWLEAFIPLTGIKEFFLEVKEFNLKIWLLLHGNGKTTQIPN